MIINNQFTAKDQIVLQSLLKQIKQLYKELKSCQHAPIQSTIIWSIKPKCDEALQILSKCSESSEFIIKRKQISQIKQKVTQVEIKLQKQEKINPQIGNGGRRIVDKNYDQADLEAQIRQSMDFKIQTPQETIYEYKKVGGAQNKFKQNYVLQSEQESQRSSISRASLQILRSIAMQQIKSVDLKYKKQEFEEILTKLQSNNELMKHIEGMVLQQGHNLDTIEQHIEKAYTNVEGMNNQLTSAEKQQIKAVNKVRKAFQKSASCFWGFLTWPFRKMGRKKVQVTTPTPVI